MKKSLEPVLARELEYHERLYSGFAQEHFARAAVRALRMHMAARILAATRAGSGSRVLSLGCGIGDTEILLASHVGSIVGVDLSPKAIAQARQDAARAGVTNTRFVAGDLRSAGLPAQSFDVVIGIFFLHHLPDSLLAEMPGQLWEVMEQGGRLYALDPSRYRLSGAIGSLLIPKLMRKYQSPDERELNASEVAGLFRRRGFECELRMYDFVSSPLAGLLPGWRTGYQVARAADDFLIRTPFLKKLGSNFELIACKPR